MKRPYFEATETRDGYFDVRLNGQVSVSGTTTEYNLLGVNRATAVAAAEHLDIPILWLEPPSSRRRWLWWLRVKVFGRKSWGKILGEFVDAALTGVFIYAVFSLTHQSNADVWSFAFAWGLFVRGLRP